MKSLQTILTLALTAAQLGHSQEVEQTVPRRESGVLNVKHTAVAAAVSTRDPQARSLLRGHEERRKPPQHARRKIQDGETVTCTLFERKIRVNLLTDAYGTDNSWEFRKTDENGDILMQSEREYGSQDTEVRELCIMSGDYEFIFRDSFGDGLCCSAGEGYIRLQIWNQGQWQFIAEETEFTEKMLSWNFFVSSGLADDRNNDPPTKEPTNPPTRKPTSSPTARPTPQPQASRVSACDKQFDGGQRCFKVEIRTDQYGDDTSWQIRNADGDVLLENNRAYQSNEFDSREICVPRDTIYEFRVDDNYGDGMCCHYGEGYYKVYVKEDYQQEGEWEKIIEGGHTKEKKMIHLLNTTEPVLTERECEWLTSHNTRRERFHTQYNQPYVPLKWSDSLEEEARVWATHLLGNCGHDMYHDKDRIHGENVAANSGGGTWGQLKSVEKVMTRFTENEQNWSWPANSHFTQVLWRSSKYVGCADMAIPYGNGGMCRTQVCRYARTGNCAVKTFNNGQDRYWMDAVMNENSKCGEICPSDGCR